MTGAPTIALQINMHPRDAALVRHCLPHQLRIFGGQVTAVHCTVDTHRSKAGRYHDAELAADAQTLRAIIAEAAGGDDRVRIDEVDYGDTARAAVSEAFLGRAACPVKAWDGGPFYAYFYGLWATGADYVLHMDCDMLFGGGSQGWIAEALALMAAAPDCLFAGPLPGPPRPDGSLGGSHGVMPGLDYVQPPMRVTRPEPAWRFSTVSTRIFLMHMDRFRARVCAVPLIPPPPVRRMQARLFGHEPIALPAEALLSRVLAEKGLSRIDFLGAAPGLWSLHPPFRTPGFYDGLPALIARVEAGEMPPDQLGEFDIQDSLVDWSPARAERTRPKRVAKALRQLAGRFR